MADHFSFGVNKLAAVDELRLGRVEAKGEILTEHLKEGLDNN